MILDPTLGTLSFFAHVLLLPSDYRSHITVNEYACDQTKQVAFVKKGYCL